MSAWKPGDVAMVECSDGGWRRATLRLLPTGEQIWQFPDGLYRRVSDSHAQAFAWKAGDVALITREDGAQTVGIWPRYGFGWQCVESGAPIREARLLMVIDPQSFGFPARHIGDLLEAAAVIVEKSETHECTETRVLRQLRDLFDAAVAEPKPDEPLGDFAVVETDSRDHFVRASWGGSQPWFRLGSDKGHHWNQVAAVKVLSKGVTS